VSDTERYEIGDRVLWHDNCRAIVIGLQALATSPGLVIIPLGSRFAGQLVAASLDELQHVRDDA